MKPNIGQVVTEEKTKGLKELILFAQSLQITAEGILCPPLQSFFFSSPTGFILSRLKSCFLYCSGFQTLQLLTHKIKNVGGQ